MSKKFRNGNSVLESAKDATGRAAEMIRGAIRWNAGREKVAIREGRHKDARRHAANQAEGTLRLVKIAQVQANG